MVRLNGTQALRVNGNTGALTAYGAVTFDPNMFPYTFPIGLFGQLGQTFINDGSGALSWGGPFASLQDSSPGTADTGGGAGGLR